MEEEERRKGRGWGPSLDIANLITATATSATTITTLSPRRK